MGPSFWGKSLIVNDLIGARRQRCPRPSAQAQSYRDPAAGEGASDPRSRWSRGGGRAGLATGSETVASGRRRMPPARRAARASASGCGEGAPARPSRAGRTMPFRGRPPTSGRAERRRGRRNPHSPSSGPGRTPGAPRLPVRRAAPPRRTPPRALASGSRTKDGAGAIEGGRSWASKRAAAGAAERHPIRNPVSARGASRGETGQHGAPTARSRVGYLFHPLTRRSRTSH